MKYTTLTLIIFSFLMIDLSFATEKDKNNYFGDDSHNYRAFKKNSGFSNKDQKNRLKDKTSGYDFEAKRDSKYVRIKSGTAKH